MMGLQYKKIKKVWQKLGVISKMQLGCQAGMGTEEARWLRCGTYEYSYLHNANIATFTEDKKHAFDSPTHVMFHLGMLYIGLPSELIQQDGMVNYLARMCVRFEGGTSPWFKRGGWFGVGRADGASVVCVSPSLRRTPPQAPLPSRTSPRGASGPR